MEGNFEFFLKILATSNAGNICGISYADTELKCSGNLGHLVAKYKSYISPSIKRGVERSRVNWNSCQTLRLKFSQKIRMPTIEMHIRVNCNKEIQKALFTWYSP
jgi:hypothetical protein